MIEVPTAPMSGGPWMDWVAVGFGAPVPVTVW